MFFCKKYQYWSSILLLGITFPALAADRVESTSFENGAPNWVSIGTNAKIVPQSPHSGNASVRGNLNSNQLDPLTNLQGSGLASRVELAPDYLSNTTTEAYIEYWFRLDDCKWDGTGFSYKNDTDPYRVDMKFAYLRKGQNPEDSFYLSGGVGESGSFRLAANDNNKNNWMTETHDSLWGRYTLYFNTPVRVGADGIWHKFAMHLRYQNPNPILRLYIDDHLLIRTDTGGGDIPMPSTYRLDTLQIPYTGNAQVNQSIPRTGVCNGWQIDDITIWNGFPNITEIPTPTINKRPLPPDNLTLN